jgi:hypothetical protein
MAGTHRNRVIGSSLSGSPPPPPPISHFLLSLHSVLRVRLVIEVKFIIIFINPRN